MTPRLVISSLVAVAGGLEIPPVAARAADEPKPSSCAMVRSIDNWKQVDESTAIIETSPNRKFKVTFNAPCRDMKWSIFARIETRPSAGLCLSPGDTIVFGRGAPFGPERFEFEERCMIKSIEAVPAEPKDAPP